MNLEELLAQLEGIADLTDEQVDQLLADFQQYGRDITADDAEVTDETVGQMRRVAEALDAIEAEQTRRSEAAAEREAAAEALRERLRGPEDNGGGEGGDGGEGEDDGDTDPAPSGSEEREPVSAAGTTVPPARNPGRTRRQPDTAPAPVRATRTLVASANAVGIDRGADMSNPADLAAAFREQWRLGNGYRGGRIEVPVVTASFSWPEDRLLDDNLSNNEDKIRAIVNPDAITAAGGICAPAPIDYSLPTIGSTARPLRDALPNFGAVPRGRVRTLTPPTIEDVPTAITVWTEANDVTPSSPATKGCLTVTCGADSETSVDAIVQCISAGNFMDRFFPERIASFNRLAAVWQARIAEQQLLAKIAAGSLAITAGTVLGTTRDVMAALDRYLASTRYFYRLDDSERFRCLAPRWLRDNMRTDLLREASPNPEQLAVADAFIANLFAARGVNVTWLMEGESGQRYVKPVAGGLQPWVSNVSLYLFLEGAWLYLNGGTLNLGVVRDSTLNATNQFQMFAEDFEQVHFHGTFSHRLNIDICPDGTASAPKTISICTTGS
jgi:hypothetical protein